MHYEISFLKSLVITVFVETLVLWLLTRTRASGKPVPVFVVIATGFFASFATLPYLWFLLPVVVKQRLWYVILAESFAIFIESFILWGFLKINYYRCFLFSFVCNISSFVIGLLLIKAFPDFF